MPLELGHHRGLTLTLTQTLTLTLPLPLTLTLTLTLTTGHRGDVDGPDGVLVRVRVSEGEG